MSFDNIPIDLRTPGQYFEFDGSRAVRGLPARPVRVLLVGLKGAGSAANKELRQVRNLQRAQDLYNRGSQLTRMFAAYKAVDPTVDTWGFGYTDVGAGVAATATITLSGAPTAPGTISLLVAGERVRVGVLVGQSLATIATNIVAKFGGDLPVNAASAGAVVTLTAKQKGSWGNDIDVRANYYREERDVPGLAVAIGAMSGGLTDPDLTDMFTALGDTPFDFIVSGFNDTANLAVLTAGLAARAGPLQQIDGVGIAALRATFAQLGTAGVAQNSPDLVLAGMRATPFAPSEHAAAIGAIAALHGGIDPARPFTDLVLTGLVPPGENIRFTRGERDILLHEGISTCKVDSAGQVLVERLITTYQRDAAGLNDTAYLDLNTRLTLSYLRYSMRARIAQRFPRCKLADDGAVTGPGSNIVTPLVIKAELLALYADWAEAGLVDGSPGARAQFKADLVVERDPSDVNRVNALIPPDLINQLLVTAGQVQFRQ